TVLKGGSLGVLDLFARDYDVQYLSESNFDMVTMNEKDFIVFGFKQNDVKFRRWTAIVNGIFQRLRTVTGIIVAVTDYFGGDFPAPTGNNAVVKLYPKGRKDAPVLYSGLATEEGIIQFLKQHSTVNMDQALPENENP